MQVLEPRTERALAGADQDVGDEAHLRIGQFVGGVAQVVGSGPDIGVGDEQHGVQRPLGQLREAVDFWVQPAPPAADPDRNGRLRVLALDLRGDEQRRIVGILGTEEQLELWIALARERGEVFVQPLVEALERLENGDGRSRPAGRLAPRKQEMGCTVREQRHQQREGGDRDQDQAELGVHWPSSAGSFAEGACTGAMAGKGRRGNSCAARAWRERDLSASIERQPHFDFQLGSQFTVRGALQHGERHLRFRSTGAHQRSPRFRLP